MRFFGTDEKNIPPKIWKKKDLQFHPPIGRPASDPRPRRRPPACPPAIPSPHSVARPTLPTKNTEEKSYQYSAFKKTHSQPVNRYVTVTRQKRNYRYIHTYEKKIIYR